MENTNTLIAKFLGYQILNKKYQYRNFNSSDESYFEDGEGEIVCDKDGKEFSLFVDSDPIDDLDDIPFDSDWNLLMEAVTKINERDWVTLYSDECKIHSLRVGEFQPIKVIKEESLFNAVYEAVVKYINWFNEQGKNSN